MLTGQDVRIRGGYVVGTETIRREMLELLLVFRDDL